MTTYLELQKADIDLSGVDHVEERRAVAASIDRFEDISSRESEATKDVNTKIREIADRINAEAAARIAAETAELRAELKRIEAPFIDEYAALQGYPGLLDGWQMHDDHLGVYCCEISGLPLRDDDDVVEWGDGDALAVLAERHDGNTGNDGGRN
jgi:hypothetical protein